jgi:hypothetical protein
MSALQNTCAALLVLALTAGCASTADLRSDYDKSVDFSQYRTYDFFADAGPEGTEYQGFFSRYMVQAISKEMEARGYVKSSTPDLLVNFNARLEDKTKVTTTPSSGYGMGGGYYGYRRGYYDPWAGYGYGTQTNVSQYTEGTINIDLVDARSRQLVWETVGVGRITDTLMDDLEARVNEGVPRFFESYPFRAGSNTPAVK